MYRNKQNLVIEHIYGDNIESYGSFTLNETDSETDTDLMKFYCQWKHFHTIVCKPLLLGIGLDLGRCEHTIRLT